jgi:hypothetical protein
MMNNNAGYVKGQKVITPAGEGEILEIVGVEVKVKLISGEEQSFPEEEVQDDSDAG